MAEIECQIDVDNFFLASNADHKELQKALLLVKVQNEPSFTYCIVFDVSCCKCEIEVFTDILWVFFQDATKSIDNAIKDYEKQSVRSTVYVLLM